MCSLFLYLCLFSLCFADKVKPPKSEKDDVEVFQKIVLPPLLTPKDSAPPTKLGKLTWGNKWNSRVVRPFGRDQVGVGTGGWYDRSNPGNEVPTWDVTSYRNGPPSKLWPNAPIPPDLQSAPYPYILKPERLAAIRANMFYPFFDQGGDSGIGDFQKDIHASSPQLHKNLNFQLPFFGFRYNYTRISMHGHVEFSDPPEHYTYPLSFPISDWPKKNDPAFIGIFFSKCRVGSIRPTDLDQRTPGVYFRMERDLQARQDWYGVEMRERVKWDIRSGVVGAQDFEPKHMAIITWKNVSFAGGIDNSLYKTNTFQMVLVTDEVFGYVMFNYRDIQWTTHTEAGGDTTGGEGGTPAFVGFNAGNGTRSYEYKPFSQSTAVRDLISRGWGNNMTGRHIFRIDENILPGSCNKDIAGANLNLVFAPESANMLGGTAINITGPCFLPGMKIKCRFDTEGVDGFVDTSLWPNRAVCVMPFVMAEGYVKLDISIDGGAYNWKGNFFVETPATATQYVFFDTDNIHDPWPDSIPMRWDARNLTLNMNSNVNITLWGYRETTIRPELVLIDVLQMNVPNSGLYTIIPSDYKNRNNYMTSDIRFGFIKIQLIPQDSSQSNGMPLITPVLWSRPIPLGWYFAPQWQRLYGNSWASAICDKWLMDDRYLKNFAAEVAQCPCTLGQALVDKGRFMPDFDCDIDRNPKCQYNKGAVHCVKTGSPSLEGSEQQCCYDKNFYLMLSYDQQWGSKPRRSHNLGYLPWNEANKVPTLSQWFHDISPFYFCCKWQEEQAVGCETYRFERRPSQDCVAYQPPYVATVFGDPHIITFDELEYTFNGKGEYVLVHVNSSKAKFDVQGRFEQLPNNFYGPVNATQLTSIAAQDNTSAVIEVRLRPSIAQWRYRMDVFANKKRVYFDRPSLRVQHFPGVTVYQPSYILNQSQIVIMFQSGAGVEIIENKGYMAARVYLPWTFIGQTSGLFGVWDFNPADDLTDSQNISYPVTWGPGFSNKQPATSFQGVYQFANSWRLEDKEKQSVGGSLFVHEYTRSASYYSDPAFLPDMSSVLTNMYSTSVQTYDPRAADAAQAKALCGDSFQCQYDYFMSLNKELASTSLLYQGNFLSIRRNVKQRVITCGILETPRFGRKSNFFFTPGTKVTFECNQDFVLVGDQRRTCTAQGQWDVPIYGYTECLREEEYSMRSLFFTWIFIIVVMGGLCLALVCIGHRYALWRRKQNIVIAQPRASRPTELRRNNDREEMRELTSPDTEIS
ncbi:protein mesh isoform X2 [Macrosteles quadrilineatus]|uniref:protein mesh isoform X2 n=1 Tax=Macrosteles quadrilineatus TaxID=74068 RepID=UPI0023E2F349|nr:protein mesh isoform X2 [Macrosteles quadrilineatus]